MCYFMGQKINKDTFIKLKEIEKQLGSLAAMDALKDGFRYADILVLKNTGNNDFELVKMHWEFIPIWTKRLKDLQEARKQGIPWLNAKGETLLTSKMFRDAALKRRCLIPASDFFEWRSYKPEGEKKEISYPYAIKIKGQEYFYIAGIWQQWTDKETGETLETVAVVTTAANAIMEQIHNKQKRQPTILPEDKAYEWLLGNLIEQQIVALATYQISPELMEAHTVSKQFKAMDAPTEFYSFNELPDLV